jgi:hypothetical protein
MLGAAAEQRELDVLALVQERKRSRSVGRGVARGEEDGLHLSACS